MKKNYYTKEINLCVPFLNDEAYIRALCETAHSSDKSRCIYEVYGSLSQDPVGNLRPPKSLLRTELPQLADKIRILHENGIKFDYVMNSELLPVPLSREYLNTVLAFLQSLSEIGVDEITVTVPYLVSLIKRNFPHIKINASICNEIASVKEALEFEELGADILVPDRDSNRNFPLLREIGKQTSCGIKVLCNSACVFHCINVHYHGTYSSALSSSALDYFHYQNTEFDTPYCAFYCRYRFFKDTSELIKMHWIRPEDLTLYSDAGVHFFKIDGRDKSAAYLLHVVNAYLQGTYDGNFFHLLQPEFCENIQDIRTDTEAAVPLEDAVLDELTKAFLEESADWKVGIHNSDLHDFNKAFADEKIVCLGNCQKCGYCNKYAQKIIIAPDWQQKILKVMEYNLERFFKI